MTLDQMVLVAVAIVNCFTAILTWRAHRLIEKVEVATNSMKDALVQKTGEAAFAAGKDEQRIASEAIAATLAQGLKAGSEQ